MQRRYAAFFLFFSAILLAPACDSPFETSRAYQLRARGVDRGEDGRLRWTVAVGALNDSEFTELRREAIEPILRLAEEDLAARLPGLKVSFLLDQPMNAVYLMERGLRRRSDQAPPPRLRLSVDAEAANRALLLSQRRSVAESELRLGALRRLAELTLTSGEPCISPKLSASAEIWKRYLSEQQRYDVIITNGLLFPDGVDVGAMAIAADGGVEMLLGAALGRTAMEGFGAILSWNEWMAGHNCRRGLPARATLPAKEAQQAAAARLSLAVLPLFSALGPKDRPDDGRALQQRLNLLAAYGDFVKGKAGACAIITAAGSQTDRAGGDSVWQAILEAREATRQGYLRDCKKTE